MWTIIFMLKTGEVLSMLVAVMALVYFCVEHPRPQTRMWKILITYITVVSTVLHAKLACLLVAHTLVCAALQDALPAN